jgi:hypothetical protein
MNYPRPVNHVKVSEVNRAPFKLFGGTLPGAVPSAIHKLGAHKHAAGEPCNDQCYEGEYAGEYEGAVEGPYEGQIVE